MVALRNSALAAVAVLVATAVLSWVPVQVAASVDSALCRQTRNETIVGTCITYPSQGICSKVLAGQKVYFPIVAGEPANVTFFNQEVYVVAIMAVLRANKGLVDDACLEAGDAYACRNIWPSCTIANPATQEGIPQLPCESGCRTLWSACRIPFNQFNIGTILGTKTFNVKDFSFGHCPSGEFGIGTFEQGPQPTDIIGQRFIRTLGPIIAGYKGQPRAPKVSAEYILANTTKINVQCNNFAPATSITDISAISPPPKCTFPLESDGDKCVIPCPFPVISEADQGSIETAFIVPAFFALFFCLFVFLDSCFVIAESQGFNDFLKLRRKLLKNTTHETEQSLSGTGQVGATSGTRRRRTQLRAATLYSLLGATLGIIFFFIGPLVTLVRKEFVSCGVDPVTIDLGDVARGTADLTDSYCKSQRVAPFILQMIFNLILYAIVRVFLVVTEKSRHWDDRRRLIFDVLLIGYCAGIPLLFLIVAFQKDSLSRDVVDFITQFSRSSAICVPRLSVGDEVVLVFMPFIITGSVITALSFYIYMHLNQISKGVTGLANSEHTKKNSSTVALRLLMIRLSFLGIATFLVLLIFISASGSLIATMSNFAPKFNAFFGCELTKASQCQTCKAEAALMFDALPSSVAFAAQIAAMSSISLLFGGFFAAQSFARLYKEYQDGILQVKLFNLFHGKPIALPRAQIIESSMNSFSNMQEKMAETKDAVKQSCLAIWYGRYQEFRNSIRGRGRGQVFRWQNRNPTQGHSKFDFVPRSWDSKKQKNPEWEGVVGGMSPYSEGSSEATSSSAAWKTSINQKNGKPQHTESWAAPGIAAWNNSLQPSTNYGYKSPVAQPQTKQTSKNAEPVFPIIEDDDVDGTLRRPPSHCPSI